MWYFFKIKKYIYFCVLGTGGCTMVRMWRLEDKLNGSVFFFECGFWGLYSGRPVGGKCLYLMSHFTGLGTVWLVELLPKSWAITFGCP